MHELTILFDGGCPLCKREVNFLKKRDLNNKLFFVDINDKSYDKSLIADIDYITAMERIHAVDSEGIVLKDLDVFRRAYQLIDIGWVYSPTKWPFFAYLFNQLYSAWAVNRLFLTRRPNINKLCQERCSS